MLQRANAAAAIAATKVHARPRDGSFLEATLETALVACLPGEARTDQQRRRFDLSGYEPFPFGVDIDWSPRNGVSVGLEVKVTDVLDALFDAVKLATAVAQSRLVIGICAIAATETQWSRGGPVTAMAADAGAWKPWTTQELLAGPAKAAVLVERGPRPVHVPGQFETLGLGEIPMPHAATHTLGLIGVRAAVGAPCVTLS